MLKDAQFDMENLIIRDVTFLGPVSKNGYDYSEGAMRDAVRLFEGSMMFLNHPSEDKEGKPRDVNDLIATARNLRFAEKVRGDMHFPDTPFIREELFPRIKHFRDQIGNSIIATGQMGEVNGRETVMALTRGYSIDLVTSPAAVAGLFESIKYGGKNMKGKVLNESDRADLYSMMGGGSGSLLEELEADQTRRALNGEIYRESDNKKLTEPDTADLNSMMR